MVAFIDADSELSSADFRASEKAYRTFCGARGLLGAIGDTAWIADESLMDAVTATSGSGPAFGF